MSKQRFMVLAALLAGGAFTVPGAEMTIQPSIDGWAEHGVGGTKDTSGTTLKAQNTGQATRSYLRFAIPAFPGGTTINSAKVVMHLATAPSATRTYNLHRSDNAIPDSWTGLSMQTAVPPSALLGGVSSGTTSGVNLEWTGAAVKTTVESLLTGGNLSLVLADSTETGPGRTALFASNENETEANRPRLIMDYTEPAPPETCDGGSIVITRHDYEGPNPIAFSNANFVVNFTVTAGCKPLQDIKVQGGLASNTTTNPNLWWTCSGDAQCTGNEPVGTKSAKELGKNNHVITWLIPSLGAGTSATITIPVSASYNLKGKEACGIKNFTGGWSASGFWEDDGGIPQPVSDGPTAPLEVEILCGE